MTSNPGLSTQNSLSPCSTNGRTRRNGDTLRQVLILTGLPDQHPKGSLGKARENLFFKVSHVVTRIARMTQFLYDLSSMSLPERDILSTRKNTFTAQSTTKYCFPAMFSERGQTWKYCCRNSQVFQRWDSRKHWFVRMICLYSKLFVSYCSFTKYPGCGMSKCTS